MSLWYKTKDKDGKTVIVSTDVAGALILFIVVIGIVTAVAIPNFMSYQVKARQLEAKVTLQSIHKSATAWKASRKTFAMSDIQQLAYTIKGSPRYSYWYAINGVPVMIPGSSSARSSCDITTPPTSIEAMASAGKFIAVAKGNIDDDAMCDEWIIDETGTLKNTLNDVIR